MMSQELSLKEQQILDYIRDIIRSQGFPPSVREIGNSVGLKSSSTVHAYINKLVEKGFIKKDPVKPRALVVCADEGSRAPVIMAPMLGRVAAGVPILAVENQEFLLPLPDGFFGEGDIFLLRVKGESMVEAGINDGDMVVVRQQSTINNGEIAVAMLGDEATVKRFYREKDCFRLQPENSLLKPMYTKEVTILGKVVGLIRKY